MSISTAGISTLTDQINATLAAAADDADVNATTPTLDELTNYGKNLKDGSTTSQKIESFLTDRLATSITQQSVHTERIIVLDDAKNVYMSAIQNLDRSLLSTINSTNDTINAVNDAYQARINSGCYTDLFWRLIEIQEETRSVGSSSKGGGSVTESEYSYIYECYRINPTGYVSVGREPPPRGPAFYGGRSGGGVNVSAASTFVGVSTTTVEYVVYRDGSLQHESVPLTSLFGFEPVNLFGIKMYDEPYTKDIGDTFVTSFIGTCGIGTNVVIAMSPVNTGGLNEIRPGQLLTCNKPLVFNTDAYVITGIGVTTANLAGINTTSNAVGLQNVNVPKIILDDTTVGQVYAPEETGNYVTFTVLVDPATLGNLAIGSSTNPYTPQRIKCPMETNDIGKGVRLEFDRSGSSSGSTTWNQFMEGEVDPDIPIDATSATSIDTQIEQNRVREPVLGAGKVYHKLGFRYAPVIYTGSGQNDYRLAKEGETVIMRGARMGQPRPQTFSLPFSTSSTGGSAGLKELPSCSSATNDFLTAAINVSSTSVGGLTESVVQDRLTAANFLREDMSDLNIRIWSERQLLGDAIARQGTYTTRSSTLTNFSSLIDGVGVGT